MITYTAEQIAAMTDDELRRVIANLENWIWFIGRRSAKSSLPDAIPNWPTDANAALELIQNGNEFTVVKSEGYWMITIHDLRNIEYVITHKRFARAICEAWLAWKQAQEDQ